MKASVRNIEVSGRNFKVWSDFIKRGTFAQDENGETRQLSGSGYISTERTVKKAIRRMFLS